MKKIIDINANFIDENNESSYKDSCTGKLLIEDEICEGIIVNRETLQKYYVFGKLQNENFTIMRCDLRNYNIPTQYTAKKENGVYNGVFFSDQAITYVPTGRCKFTLIPAEVTREESEEEVLFMEKLIEREKLKAGKKVVRLYESLKKQTESKKQYQK